MTRFWEISQKINSESDENEILVTNSISTQNLSKELILKSRFKRMTKSLRNVFALIKGKWNKSSMSSNRTLKLMFRKLEKKIQ
jgi:hypothetical protein